VVGHYVLISALAVQQREDQSTVEMLIIRIQHSLPGISGTSHAPVAWHLANGLLLLAGHLLCASSVGCDFIARIE
jgi:hypothetical protein